MAKPDYPLGAIQSAIREGLKPTPALREFRAAGGKVGTQTWFRLWGQAKAMLDRVPTELDRPHETIPSSDEITKLRSISARGFRQQISIYMRDRDSGAVVTKPYSLMGPGVVTRGEAVDIAIKHYREYADEYGLVPLGGIYTGTQQLEPED